nr:MAG TPA: chromosome partitioning protein [Caudoviricetes sp.]
MENRGAITWIPVAQLYPHPDNPRKNMGDVSELAESIRAKGVMQNLTVVEGHFRDDGAWIDGEGYTIVIGHRRAAAARLAEMEELPCAVVKMTHAEQVQTMLLENMQRVDLTPVEQAEGFQMMFDFGDSVEEISKKTGFSAGTIYNRLKMAKLDRETLRRVSADADRQIGLADLDKLYEIKDKKVQTEVLDKIGTRDFDLAVQRAVDKQQAEEGWKWALKFFEKSGMQQMDAGEIYSTKWEQACTICVKGEDGRKKIEKYCQDAEKGCRWWFAKYSATVVFYKPAQKKAEKKEKKQDDAKTDAKTIVFRQQCEKMEALSEEHFRLREKFIKSLRVTEKNRELILLGGFWAGVCARMSYKSCLDEAADFAGVDKGLRYDLKKKAVVEKLPELDRDRQKELVWLLWCDNPERDFAHANNYEKEIRHGENAELWLEYQWLMKLGYEMSGEEQQMMNGTHEIYENPEGE